MSLRGVIDTIFFAESLWSLRLTVSSDKEDLRARVGMLGHAAPLSSAKSAIASNTSFSAGSRLSSAHIFDIIKIDIVHRLLKSDKVLVC